MDRASEFSRAEARNFVWKVAVLGETRGPFLRSIPGSASPNQAHCLVRRSKHRGDQFFRMDRGEATPIALIALATAAN